jgi:hypothetical protein
MISVRDFRIDTFLPLARMQAEADAARAAYAAAKPYPHVVFDNFFDPALVDEVLAEFPRPNDIPWQKFDNGHEIKLMSVKEASFGPATRLLFYHLNSATFLDFLSHVTAIPNLIPDPGFEGGGLHQIVRGGKLGVHADFNKHGQYDLDRRLNLLLYLNKDWKAEYGGNLELWDRDMKGCGRKVAPLFNRVMVFGTTDFTYHGHPEPLQCPEGMTRKSMALYYFSNGRPPEEISGEHSTLFRERRDGEFKLTPRQRIAAVARDFLPPILVRGFNKVF